MTLWMLVIVIWIAGGDPHWFANSYDTQELCESAMRPVMVDAGKQFTVTGFDARCIEMEAVPSRKS